MRKTVLFNLWLLISAVGLQTPGIGQSNNNAPSSTTIQGCLAFTNGHYRLTNSDGTWQQLSGEVNKLRHSINKQVELTGMPAIRTVDNTQEGEASSVREQEVFRVKTVKQIADSCSK